MAHKTMAVIRRMLDELSVGRQVDVRYENYNWEEQGYLTISTGKRSLLKPKTVRMQGFSNSKRISF